MTVDKDIMNLFWCSILQGICWKCDGDSQCELVCSVGAVCWREGGALQHWCLRLSACLKQRAKPGLRIFVCKSMGRLDLCLWHCSNTFNVFMLSEHVIYFGNQWLCWMPLVRRTSHLLVMNQRFRKMTQFLIVHYGIALQLWWLSDIMFSRLPWPVFCFCFLGFA